MKSILIIGAGCYGRLVKEIAELNGYTKVDFIDDNKTVAIGNTNQIEEMQENYDGCIVAIGNPKVREKMSLRCNNLVTLIHPSAVISKTAQIGSGCVIEAQAVISAETIVKDNTFICAGATVNHNSIIGKCCQIDCNAVVAMGKDVPDYTKINSCTEYR